ncbi:hypothetical protein D8666_04620 [Ochrobactrum soli]|nr:hypothetical protein D8666_04620 [[Ochrobactrum] soli]
MVISALPVLTYPNVRCTPVLENHHFRHGLPIFDSDTKGHGDSENHQRFVLDRTNGQRGADGVHIWCCG